VSDQRSAREKTRDDDDDFERDRRSDGNGNDAIDDEWANSTNAEECASRNALEGDKYENDTRE